MTIAFRVEENRIMLVYQPSVSSEEIMRRLHVKSSISDDGIEQLELMSNEELSSPICTGSYIWLKRVFYLYRNDLVMDLSDEETFIFDVGYVGKGEDAGYYVLSRKCLGINQDVLIADSISLDYRLFCVGYNRKTSVMNKISRLLAPNVTRIVIGGDCSNAIPQETYLELLKTFPTTTMLEHYGEALIQRYIQDYLEPAKDYIGEYDQLISRRSPHAFKDIRLGDEVSDTLRSEAMVYASRKLRWLLGRGEALPEEDWQRGILDILPVLFPQYVCVIPKAEVKDVLSGIKREVDYLLVDASGNVDVLEIKRAFPKRALLMARTYRDNYIPARELSGGIAQLEKYIHYLLNWSQEGEKILTEKYREKLPDGLSLRFVNPRGILLLGHCEFTQEESRDFEIVRRQYSHIADIITYDELLNRFDRILQALCD